MARKPHHPAAADTLEEIQTAADHLAAWIQSHLALVIGSIAALLVLAGGFQFAATRSARSEDAASSALSEVRAEYLAAMGAPSGSIEAPELANPEAAARIRSEYVGRFRAMAEAHRGTVSGAMALLEAGDLLAASDDPAGAIETWEEIVGGSSNSDAIRGIALQRVAYAHEDAERWTEAGERHEEASELADYPLRYWAMADAARCYAAAQENARALVLYERLEVEAPELRLPDHLQTQLRALRAAAEG